MEWIEASEIVAGLMLVGRLSPHVVDPSKFMKPYNEIVTQLRSGKDPSTIMDTVGFSPYHAALGASQAITVDMEPTKYIPILERACLRTEVGSTLSKYSSSLMKGKEVDITQMLVSISKLETGTTEFMTMDKVQREDNVWIPSYYPPIDDYMYGIPKYGMVLIGAPPGTGKTSLLAEILLSMVSSQKKVCLLSLEMTAGLIKNRMMELRPKITDKQLQNIVVSEEIYTFEEGSSAMARVLAANPDTYAFGIDFADFMIPEDRDESAALAGRLYQVIATAAKRMLKPVILLSQLNDKYIGGIPRVNHIRWSRMAEAYASMILLPYNPGQIWVDMGQSMKKNPLPYVEGKAYLIEGKSRFGYKYGSVGAVQVDWDGQSGWGSDVHGGWIALSGV